LLAQGTPGRVLLAGKALALAAVVLLMLLPLVLSAGLAVAQGEQPLAAVALVCSYGLYLLVWVALTLFTSALLKRRSAALAMLSTSWIVLVLVLPALAGSVASKTAAAAGKLETDLAMLAELRQLGDGHNANAPAFSRLRSELLAQHGVQRAEDLPVNLRGVVAQVAERRLTDVLNRYAQQQQAAENQQEQVRARHGWITPVLAVAGVSRALAGTDLAHHHRFLQEGEALRYHFVQGLNRVHAEELAYADDVRRSSDADAERRTRVDAAHWQLLQRFQFAPDSATTRVVRAGPQVLMLALWCAALIGACFWAGGRLKP
jgi:ABC-2 type transport system permease protein